MQAELTELQALRQAAGGRLVGLMEAVRPDDQDFETSFQVEYTLASGKKSVAGGGLTPEQRKKLRADEVVALWDSGAGEVISSEPFHIGLGRYTIRFTLADGTQIDLQTNYPPGTHRERQRIFTETRQLKAARQFTVELATAVPGHEIFGVLRYTLADGRQVGITEQVPADVVSTDGKQVITYEPQSGPATKRP